MKTTLPEILLTLLAFFMSFFTLGQDIQSLPKLNARVTDLTGTLNVQQSSALEIKLAKYEQTKGSQIAVVIIPTTEPEEIEQYGIRLAEKWKIGREKIDDGVILIVAKEDRKLKIEVGYGLEGAVPDAYAKRIIENVILPDFRQGQFYTGIDNGVNTIMSLIDGEKLPLVSGDTSNSNSGDVHPILTLLGLLVLIIFNITIKNKAIKMGIVAAIGVGTWLYSGIFLAGVFISIVVVIFMFTSNSGRGSGGRSYSSGGSFGGRFSGGSGSFSSGGGSFGGGGASGGW